MQAAPLVCRAGVSAEAASRDGGRGRITAAEQPTGLMEDNEKRETNQTVSVTCYCGRFTLQLQETEKDLEIYIQIKFSHAGSRIIQVTAAGLWLQ